MKPQKLSIVKKIKNRNLVDISESELFELTKLGFSVERGSNHYKISHNDLISSPTKFSSGNIIIGSHKKDKQRIDYNGAQDLRRAFEYLKYL